MRKGHWWGLTIFVALGVGMPALAQDEPKVEGDLKTLQGKWVSKDDSGESTWDFQGNKLHLKTPTREYKLVIKLDSATKPASIDFEATEDSPNSKGYKAKGIYKIENENKKVTICFGESERPTVFEADFMSTFLFELSKKAD